MCDWDPFQALGTSWFPGVHQSSIQVYEGQAEQALQGPITVGLEHITSVRQQTRYCVWN